MGSLHHFNAKMKFGIDILANEYDKESGILKHDTIYLNCPSHKMPFLNGFADVVVSRNALDHVDDFETTVNEIYRVLKSGGEIILSINLRLVPASTEPQVLTMGKIKKAFFNKFNYKIIKKLIATKERPFERIVVKGNKR